MDRRLESVIVDLQKLVKGDDLKYISELVQNFDNALSGSNRSEMQNYSKEAFTLEKKYIPLIPHNISISGRLECDNMIMTVGFQKEPIILSILCMKPKNVILLHTEGSRPIAQDIENDPDIIDMKIDILPLLITEYEASENYQIIRDKAIPRAFGETVIDPTAGRKVMVASLALVAFYWRYPMVYLHSIEHSGINFPFTERLRIIDNPFDFFGDAELAIVEEQFNCHFYEAAVKTCDQLEQHVRDLATRSKVIMLKNMIAIYRDWDSFLHSSVPEDKRLKPLLSEQFESIIDEFQKYKCDGCLPENIEANLSFLRQIDELWKNKRNITDKFRLIDIYASALRRGSEKQKKYDDAVARLYRCIEMCSTIKLIEMGLKDTEKPDYEAFAAKNGVTVDYLKEEYLKKERELPPEKLGLDNQMMLLSIVGNVIANIYDSMNKKEDGSESLRDIRNRSTLAHGTNPVTEEYWSEFRNKTEAIIKNTIGKDEFNKLLSMATHGKLHIV